MELLRHRGRLRPLFADYHKREGLMDAGKSASGNKSAEKVAALSFAQGTEGQRDLPAQERRNEPLLTQARSSNTASLLSAASSPGRHVSIIEGYAAAT
jgi:hypothetical protein